MVGEVGDGRPLFLVHGLGGSAMWEKVVEPLSRSFRVIVPDLPGFGNSDAPPHSFTTEEYAGFLKLLIDDLATGPAVLAGISYGAEVSAHVASHYPDAVPDLIVIAPTGFNITPWIARNDIRWLMFSAFAGQVLLRSRSFLSLAGAKAFHDLRKRPDDLTARYHRVLMNAEKREALVNCARNAVSHNAEFPGMLGSISSKTLILWGKEDRIVRVEEAGKFLQYIPGATLTLLDGCGHSVPLEKPEELCRSITTFLG